jgi:sarcosine oxidase, subunit gamma
MERACVADPAIAESLTGAREIVLGDQVVIRRIEASVAVLRLWQASADDIAILERVFALTWPQPNNTTKGFSRIVWLGPNEWGLINMSLDHLSSRIQEALPSGLFHLAEVTDARAIFLVAGPRAPDVLAKGCSIDLEPAVFRPGCSAQTLFAELPVCIEHEDPAGGPTPSYLVHVDRSLEHWLSLWFVEAAREFAIPR